MAAQFLRLSLAGVVVVIAASQIFGCALVVPLLVAGADDLIKQRVNSNAPSTASSPAVSTGAGPASSTVAPPSMPEAHIAAPTGNSSLPGNEAKPEIIGLKYESSQEKIFANVRLKVTLEVTNPDPSRPVFYRWTINDKRANTEYNSLIEFDGESKKNDYEFPNFATKWLESRQEITFIPGVDASFLVGRASYYKDIGNDDDPRLSKAYLVLTKPKGFYSDGFIFDTVLKDHDREMYNIRERRRDQ